MDLEKKVLWSERDNLDIKPLDFYRQHYAGSNPGDIAIADRVFYMVLVYNDLVDKLSEDANKKIRVKKNINLKINLISELSFETKAASIQKHYLLINLLSKEKITKSKKEEKIIINKKYKEKTTRNKEYKEVIKEENINLVVKKPKYIRKTPKNPWTENPAAYCLEHYPGLNRKELERENPRFYKYLWRHDLLDIVPKKPYEEVKKIISAARKRDSKFGENALAYYKENYSGISRGQLKESNPGLYQRLRADGLLGKLPKKSC